ncbi:putative Nrf1 activator activation site binding domain protein [Trypoxylus dichotomus]
MPTSIKIGNVFHVEDSLKCYTGSELKRRDKIARKKKISRCEKPGVLVERKLLRRVSKALHAYFNILGKNIAVVVQTATKPGLKIFGARGLVKIVDKFRKGIVKDLQNFKDQGHDFINKQNDEGLFKLPPLIIEGLPVPLNRMTQAQLRGFIPLMLKYSTGRGKPGWGKEQLRPCWWPDDMPWANIRIDNRSTEIKNKVHWTKALREIIFNCYMYHGRLDLLHESEEFYKHFNGPNVNFISYDDCLGGYVRGCNLREETNEVQEMDEIDYPEVKSTGVNNSEVRANNPSVITLPLNQPCYVYNLPQHADAIYFLPIHVESFNLVNVFPVPQADYFMNHTATGTFSNASPVIIQEVSDETVKYQEGVSYGNVLSIPEAEPTSYHVPTINEMVLINNSNEISFIESVINENTDYDDQQNFSNQIEDADFIFLDDAETDYILDEVSAQNVALDIEGEGTSYPIDVENEMEMMFK